jgi:hypothetical protein
MAHMATVQAAHSGYRVRSYRGQALRAAITAGGEDDKPSIEAKIRAAARRATGSCRLYNLVRTG